MGGADPHQGAGQDSHQDSHSTTSAVLVTGEAGIGKTRLVTEALTPAPPDALVLTGRAVDMATGEIPFGVLADTLRDLVRQCGAEVIRADERATLASLLPGTTPAADVDRPELMATFLDLLQRLATEQPVVWVVEDLHWADSATRDVVALVVRRRLGVRLVATVRTDDPDRSPGSEASLTSFVANLARSPGCLLVQLGRLTPAQVRQQLVTLLDDRHPGAVAAQIQRLSDGVPFVVEELAAAAGERHHVTSADVAGLRLSALGPDARRLVEAVAVGDGHLRTGLVEEVVDATPEELDLALAEAVGAGVLVHDNGTGMLGFRHSLLRDQADRAMGPGARRGWHRRWAEVLEHNPGVLATDPAALALAEHWHHAGDRRRALVATVAALPSIERTGLADEAFGLWGRILSAYGVLDDAADLVGLTLREAYGRAFISCGLASRPAWRSFDELVPRDGFTSDELLALDLLHRTEAKGEAMSHAEDVAVAAADAFEDSEADLLAIAVWASAAGRMAHDLPRGDRLIERAKQAAVATGDPRAVLFTTTVQAYRAQFVGDLEASDRELSAVVTAYPDQAWEGVLLAIGNLVWSKAVQGEHDRACALAEDALARMRHPHLMVVAWEHLLENVSACWLWTGQWARARAALEEAAPWWEDDVRCCNARLAILDVLQTGTSAEPGRWLDQAVDPAPGGASRVMSRGVLATEAGLRGDLAAVRATLSPLWDLDQVTLWDDELWEVVVAAARFEADAAQDGRLDDAGERRLAQAHLEQVCDVAARFRRYGRLGEVWPVDLSAQVERFHGRDARAPLSEALAAWERIGHQPDVAVTHLALAQAHARAGDRDRAREHLAAGRGLATSLGAGPWLARAASLASVHGLGSGGSSATDGLTARESEVLALLAGGRTNAEIAEALVISPKTASVHVSRIIAKLGAGNRTEAVAHARSQGLLGD